jgi:hypothetical protein
MPLSIKSLLDNLSYVPYLNLFRTPRNKKIRIPPHRCPTPYLLYHSLSLHKLLEELAVGDIIHKSPAGFGLNRPSSRIPPPLREGSARRLKTTPSVLCYRDRCSSKMAPIPMPALPPPLYNLSTGAEINLGKGRADEGVPHDHHLLWCSAEALQAMRVLSMQMVMVEDPHPPHYQFRSSPLCILYSL